MAFSHRPPADKGFTAPPPPSVCGSSADHGYSLARASSRPWSSSSSFPATTSVGVFSSSPCYDFGGGHAFQPPNVSFPTFASKRSSGSGQSSPSPTSDLTQPPPPADSEPPPSIPPEHTPTANESSPKSTTTPVIHLEVMVEKKSKRVMFAESNKDFIDILFSFLTLPIGSILSILGETSPPTSVGSMNNIHESVRNLDAGVFRTEACKEMLLRPRRSSEAQCNNVKLKIVDNSDSPKRFYFCKNSVCWRGWEGEVRLSDFANVRCHCGQVMTQVATLSEDITSVADDGEMGGVFVKDLRELFLISDDLQVVAGATSACLVLLKKLEIRDANELETVSLTVGPQEILQLLRLSLISKIPLTHWIRLQQGANDLTQLEIENATELIDEKSNTNETKRIVLKLFKRKSENKVLYAECGEDFVDFLFSFLTFPLGSIVQLLNGSSSLVCVDKLYQSVKYLGSNNYLKSEELQNMLISPKLAPYHACDNQLLDIEETAHPLYSLNYLDSKTEWCVRPVNTEVKNSSLGEELGQFSIVNPKYSDGETTSGGSFVWGPAKFMVTDALVVTRLSAISSISILAKLNVLIADVDATVVKIGKEEALNLLKAALVSETPLSDVFS